VSRDWYHFFTSYLISLNFTEVKLDTLLFVYHRGTDTTYLLLYVDDIIFTALPETSLAYHYGSYPLHYFLSSGAAT
jgi:hypothetical protein